MDNTNISVSLNSTKGQCLECKGAGEIAIPMHFMPDINITCSKCNGERYQEQVLKIKHMGFSIADLLNMEIGEVKEIFRDTMEIYRILDMLCKVGLVIEHNPLLINQADYLIEMDSEGGDLGVMC